MKGNSVLVIMTLFFAASCGKSPAELFGAPKTKDRLGVIASCTTKDQAQSIAEAYGAKFRVINEKKQLIEFYGLSEAELRAALPKARTMSNQIYEDLVESNSRIQAASSDNVAFFGPHTPQYRSQSTAEYFPHLEQISAHDLGSVQGQGVVIAVVDTGVYYNHPHLSPNIKYKNSDKHGASANNKDDDKNGYKDDYVGWDFYNNDAYPIDDHGHGTHVAGLAAGTLSGVAPKAKILPVKVLSSTGSGDLGTIAAGILYAVENGADVINLSLGGSGSGRMTDDLRKLINVAELAKDKGVMLVAAAGNGGDDGIGDCNDARPIYPANIDSSNVISVAAVDAYNNLTDYSNFGKRTVHVAAPGGDTYTGGLVSTGISNCNGPCTESDAYYYQSSGTSMAAPVVAGLVALMKSGSSKSNKSIKNIIMKYGSEISSLKGKVKSGQVIDVRASLDAALN